MPKDLVAINNDISALKQYWAQRNTKLNEWYELLVLIDKLGGKGLESYTTNEPQTFYNMAHYLLTKGELSHEVPIMSEASIELDRRAKINDTCNYLWSMVDRSRKLGGESPFVDEIGFWMLVCGWYAVASMFDQATQQPIAQAWSPLTVYPRFAANNLIACVHEYSIPQSEAVYKALSNNWNYKPMGTVTDSLVVIDDYFWREPTSPDLFNTVLIDGKDVTGTQQRPEMVVLVGPVAGFPTRGDLQATGTDWRQRFGRSIFEVNSNITSHFNKWKTEVSQMLRDTAQGVMQEFSATPKATPEQVRERGALFHYAPGEAGLQRVAPAQMPIEMQTHMLDIRREMQKGSFSDAVYGMMEGQPGYSLSLMASSSANQILYPYMDAKHFIVSELDRFWLTAIKQGSRVFNVKGKFIIQIKSSDIPDDVLVNVNSEVATPQDWLERGTIAGMLRDIVDEDTILTEILRMNDPQGIKRKKNLDRALNHPMSQMIQLISSYQLQADYLDARGDTKQGALFRVAAAQLEQQLGAPAPGQANPQQATRVASQIEQGTPREVTNVPSRVAPPETQGFQPQQLRRLIGRGTVTANRGGQQQ